MRIVTVALALVGLAGLAVHLSRTYTRTVAGIAIALVAAATPLTWYSLFEPAPIELAAFAVVAWCLVPAERGRPGSSAMMASWAALCVIPLAIVLQRTVIGHPFALSFSHAIDVLFSSRFGFLAWTPALYVGVVGALLLTRRSPVASGAALGVLAIAALLVGSSGVWQENPAAATRSLLPVTALLAGGLAHVAETARRRPLLALAPLIALPLAWNYLLMVQYTVGMLPKDEPISFGRMVRQQADLYARTAPLYPFSFPANIWFAWRAGVPVDRYDTLSAEPLSRSIDLALDRTAERYLLEGWSGPTAEGEGQGWWIGERHASIALPLAVEAGSSLRVAVTARSRYEEPIVEADLALLVNGHEVGTFSPGAEHASEATFTVTASLLRSGINTLTIASRGTHRVDPSDTRPPGPVARRAARSAWPVAVYRIAISRS